MAARDDDRKSAVKLGFIGLGAMGLPMTRNLLAAGHDVRVASRSRPPIDAAVAAGATDAGTIAGVAAGAEVIFICVPNSPEVSDVVDELLGVLGTGQIVVDASTIDPDVEREQHRRVTATGAGYLDGPLSGGTIGAQKRDPDRHGRRGRHHPRFGAPRARSRLVCSRARRRAGDGPGGEALQQPHLRGPDARHCRGDGVGAALGSGPFPTSGGAHSLDR